VTLDRVIAAAIALAAATLIGLCVGFALGAFDSGASGPPGSVSDDCRKYATANAKAANLHDSIIKGIVGVGFQAGQTEPGAIVLLKTIGTSYYVVSPFHQYAIVCVKPGFEQSWAAQLKAMDWVEYAHPEGVIPILTLPQ
jgi:hypothetical protein